MKTTFITLIFVFVGLLAKAQQSELVNNTWYLESITINGTTTLTPNNTELSVVTANFTTTSLVTTAISTFVGYNLGLPIIDNTTIQLNDFYFDPNLQNCQMATNCTFQNNYFWFLGPYNNNAPKSYIITNQGSNKKLVITSSNGHQAVYNNSNLSVNNNELESKKISVFPNPITDILTIKGKYGASKVMIFDSQSKLILTKIIENKSAQENIEINVSNLISGVYTLVINDIKSNKTQATFKIIKK